MIFLFTDYGVGGPYVGQLEAVLHQHLPEERVINLMANAPRNNPKAGAYLLASLSEHIPTKSVFLCVVDPGVGSNQDKPVILNINHRWYVGPDNGLFDIVARQDIDRECWQITWKPEYLSNSFHGRDLYAPVCSKIVNREAIPGDKVDWKDQHQWPDDLNEVIYIDHFGNCITGIRADQLDNKVMISINNQKLLNANTFSDVPAGKAFWYENSNGLVEIAVNQGSAAENLELKIGSRLLFST
ncbi:MAG: SAM-dependent chlorinase/fluorinase [Pseudomonadota bacterium]